MGETEMGNRKCSYETGSEWKNGATRLWRWRVVVKNEKEREEKVRLWVWVGRVNQWGCVCPYLGITWQPRDPMRWHRKWTLQLLLFLEKKTSLGYTIGNVGPDRVSQASHSKKQVTELKMTSGNVGPDRVSRGRPILKVVTQLKRVTFLKRGLLRNWKESRFEKRGLSRTSHFEQESRI